MLEKLFATGAHFGYAPRSRHPSVASFIFGQKGGVEIIDLEQTARELARAVQFVAALAAERKVILFVGGKAEARGPLAAAAERIGAPHVAGRWIGGTLTNFPEIKKRLARLTEHQDMREKGELAKFTKRERLLIDREIEELDRMFGGLKSLQKVPDALFIVDPRRESTAVLEAKGLGIPVIAILNTDCDRSGVAYPIPANDASREAIALILEEITSGYQKALPKE